MHGLIKKALWCLGHLVLTGCMLGIGFFISTHLFSQRVAKQLEIALSQNNNNTQIYAADRQRFASLSGMQNRYAVPISKISGTLQKAVLAIEDKRFFSHAGIDPRRIAAAFLVNVSGGAILQGGSTITQQLIKLTLLQEEVGLKRKIKELFFALAIENHYSKLQLLEQYLNRIYLGHGIYGVEQASQSYFHKSANDLALNEAIFLAALLKKPEGYLEQLPIVKQSAPSLPLLTIETNSALAQRYKQVLKALRQIDWITAADAIQAHQLPIIYQPQHAKPIAPYYVQEVQRSLRKLLGVEQTIGVGYHIDTTLNLKMQQVAEQEIARIGLENVDGPEIALIAIDVNSGAVKALVGGVDFDRSKFNRATQALRQPGSTFKPLLYATALENGYHPHSLFMDAPVVYHWQKSEGMTAQMLNGKVLDTQKPAFYLSAEGAQNAQTEASLLLPYMPLNYGNRYGLLKKTLSEEDAANTIDAQIEQMTLRRALELSSNVIAVQLLHQMGYRPLFRQLSRWQIAPPKQVGLCIALGCAELSLATLTSAYASFANGGHLVKPLLVEAVRDRQGQIIYQRQPLQLKQVLSEWTAFQMRLMLQGVLKHGTGWRARMNRMQVGGKTGTNDGHRDAWFVGFSSQLVVGIWMGYDDNRSMPGVHGGKTPAILWRRFMKKVARQLPPSSFPTPPQPHLAVQLCNTDGEVVSENCPDSSTYYLAENEATALLLQHAEEAESAQSQSISSQPNRAQEDYYQ